jgi:4-hydroxybenzoate polyprenyltransferase
MVVLLLLTGLWIQFAWPWFLGVAVATGLFAWQQYMVRSRNRDACFKAFLNNNWVGMAIWVGLLANYAII